MTSVALSVEAGATASSIAATLDISRLAERFDPADPPRLALLSAAGGAVALADGMRRETRALPPRLDG